MTGFDRGAWFVSLARQAMADEPPAGDVVATVFRRADRLRRRRIRSVVASGLAAVTATGALGYGLTAALLSSRVQPRTVAVVPAGGTVTASVPADPVLAIVAPVAGTLVVTPRQPGRGAGWRQYAVRDEQGPRGLIEISVYAAPDGLCFPVLADAEACARPDRAGPDTDYVRYTFADDVDWQVTEVIARRPSDGRTTVVQATGERGTGVVRAGRPPLTAAQAARLAVDDRLAAAFSPVESCNGPDPGCPLLRVPVPVAD